MSDYNQRIIEEFRANGGRLGGSWDGRDLLLLTTTGRKTGRKHTTPIVFTRGDDRLLVYGSNSGGPSHSDWYLNLLAQPRVVVEVGAERYDAIATPLEPEERDREFAAQVARNSVFGDYEQKTDRVIPVIALNARGEPVSGPQGPVDPAVAAERPIDPLVRIGHVHLRTADIDRVRAFYVDVLGFDVVHEARDVPGWGTTGDVLFVSAGGYHHHLGFNTWKSANGPEQPDGVAGLHHVALNFSTREQLARTVGRVVDAGIPLRQLTDHGTHLAVYLSDPDGNDLELAWDRPFDEWPGYGPNDEMVSNVPFDLDELLSKR